MLPAGKYDLKVVKGDAADVNADALIEAVLGPADVKVEDGKNLIVYATAPSAAKVLTPSP